MAKSSLSSRACDGDAGSQTPRCSVTRKFASVAALHGLTGVDLHTVDAVSETTATAATTATTTTTSAAILAQIVDIRRGFLRLGALSNAILSKRTRFILSSLVFCVLDSGCRSRRYPCRNSMSPSLEPSLELWLSHTRCLWVGTP